MFVKNSAHISTLHSYDLFSEHKFMAFYLIGLRDNINYEVGVRRTYGLLTLFFRSTTCFWAQFRVGRQKFGTICL